MKTLLAGATLALAGAVWASEATTDHELDIMAHPDRYEACGPVASFLAAWSQYGFQMPVTFLTSSGKTVGVLSVKSRPGYFIVIEFEKERDSVCVIAEGMKEED